MQWKQIKHEYINTDAAFKDLAAAYNIKPNIIRYRARKEGWKKKKNTDDILERINIIADSILDKIEIALDELDTYMIKKKSKTKSIEYTEENGKPEKETIEELEFIQKVQGIIDRNELKTLCSVLKELQSIYTNNSEENSQGKLEMLLRGISDENIQ